MSNVETWPLTALTAILTAITTNLSFDRWEEIFSDAVMTAAMIDRLTHKSYLLNMNGSSYRLKETREWLARQEEEKDELNWVIFFADSGALLEWNLVHFSVEIYIKTNPGWDICIQPSKG